MNDLLDLMWGLLERGVRDRTLATNRPTLATVGGQLRTVVLRAVSRSAQTLDIHSDARAGKVAQLRADPTANLHVWDTHNTLQIRIRAAAQVHRDDQIAAKAFTALPDHGQRIYRVTPHPGTPISDPRHITFEGQPHFALIRLHLQEVELLHLDRDVHRRALFTAGENWRGRWLVP